MWDREDNAMTSEMLEDLKAVYLQPLEILPRAFDQVAQAAA